MMKNAFCFTLEANKKRFFLEGESPTLLLKFFNKGLNTEAAL